MLRIFSVFVLVLVPLELLANLPYQQLQVPCFQTFLAFTKNWEDDCSSACYVVCPEGCYKSYSADLVTGSLFYTVSTPICFAALFEGVASYERTVFSVRAGGDQSRFTGASSRMGTGNSKSSNSTQRSWFIEPFERVYFLLEPQDTTVQLGERLTLTCEINDRSRGDITWYNNDTPLEWSSTVDCKGEKCRIQHAETKYSGWWQCKVRTSHSGTLVSRYSRVTVAYLNTSFLYQPRDHYRAYTEGGGKLTKISSDFTWPLVLPCAVDSEPPAKITWYKNDKIFNVRHAFQYKDGSLYFMIVDDRDTGSYKCSGYNSYTNQTITSSTFWLQKVAEASRPGPEQSSIISQTTESIKIASPGDTVVLTCVARGNPIPTISWSTPLTNKDSPRISRPAFGRNLVIEDFNLKDQGIYKCTAMNENDYYGIGAVFVINLRLQTFPAFSIHPSDEIHNKGEEATLRCGLQNRGSMFWLKDGVPVKLNRSKIEMQGDYLIIKDMSTQDTGMYQCVGLYISDKYKFVTQTSALLSVRSKPKITADKRDMIHEAGKSIEINCNAIGFPYPYVTWEYNGAPLLFTERVRQNTIQSMVIENADGSDYGDYTCVARNGLGTASLTRLLNILVKAKIKGIEASDRRGYFLTGNKIVLTCIAAGTKDLAVSWTKDSYSTKSNVVIQEESILDLPDYSVIRSTLTIPSSNQGDEGMYRCKATNYLNLGNKNNWKQIRIRVFSQLIAPQLVSGPINTVVTEEKNMLVTCVFTGAPPPTVLWRINDQEVQEDGRMTLASTEDGLTSNLMIRDATKADSGNYSCEGVNEAGSTERGLLTISLYYTNGLTNGTNSTLRIIATIPAVFFVLLFL